MQAQSDACGADESSEAYPEDARAFRYAQSEARDAGAWSAAHSYVEALQEEQSEARDAGAR
ncbi:MAG TPA: hypothetical protein VMF89_02490, partial [Polyangiales bacterium]|nr:hypothetical protein [Polyangiales bacterium]